MSTVRTSRTLAGARLVIPALLFGAAAFCAALPVRAHEVWIETVPTAKQGEAHEVHICWGHSGHKETGRALAAQQSKLTACVSGPDGRKPLTLAQGSDSFNAKFAPAAPGCYAAGAEVQVGIIDREFHGMPPKTRMVMFGKSVTNVGAVEGKTAAPLGFDLEIVPVSPILGLKAGDLVTVKVLHKGRPIGGKKVLVSAKTSGALPPPKSPKVLTSEWSIESTADPVSGEVTFPLIVGGQHQFYVKYTDETRGTYQGERNDSSRFSHLRKGDAYERTVYVSTLTVPVKAK